MPTLILLPKKLRIKDYTINGERVKDFIGREVTGINVPYSQESEAFILEEIEDERNN